uniref:KEN domain-containing protein n=1 Tax=Brassica oleracea var. oleracea TaxID=109376 RepID=A0A0D3DZB8_BRAOL
MKEILGTTQKDVLEYFSASFPQLLLQTYHVINEHFQTDPAFLAFAERNAPQVPVSDRCMAEVSQRLSYAKESASRNVSVQSHGDLARKLQEEMEKNRRSSSGSREGSGRRMKEVACPTCTVLLLVQVPISGSETIECGFCQNPFLVSSH